MRGFLTGREGVAGRGGDGGAIGGGDGGVAGRGGSLGSGGQVVVQSQWLTTMSPVSGSGRAHKGQTV